MRNRIIITSIVCLALFGCAQLKVNRIKNTEFNNEQIEDALDYIITMEEVKRSTFKDTIIYSDYVDPSNSVGLVYFKSKVLKTCHRSKPRKGYRGRRICNDILVHYPVLFLRDKFYYITKSENDGVHLKHELEESLKDYFSDLQIEEIIQLLLKGCSKKDVTFKCVYPKR